MEENETRSMSMLARTPWRQPKRTLLFETGGAIGDPITSIIAIDGGGKLLAHLPDIYPGDCVNF